VLFVDCDFGKNKGLKECFGRWRYLFNNWGRCSMSENPVPSARIPGFADALTRAKEVRLLIKGKKPTNL